MESICDVSIFQQYSVIQRHFEENYAAIEFFLANMECSRRVLIAGTVPASMLIVQIDIHSSVKCRKKIMNAVNSDRDDLD